MGVIAGDKMSVFSMTRSQYCSSSLSSRVSARPDSCTSISLRIALWPVHVNHLEMVMLLHCTHTRDVQSIHQSRVAVDV